MKQFRDLIQVDRQQPADPVGRVTRTMSFQSLAQKKQQGLSKPNSTFKGRIEAIQLKPQKQEDQHMNSLYEDDKTLDQLRAARQERQANNGPTLKVRRANLKQLQQQTRKIEGVPVATSMTVSVESVNPSNKENLHPNHPTPDRLNTEECQEISDKLSSIKESLMKGIIEKTRNGNDMNTVLADMRKQLDASTQLIMEEVMAKRRNKEVYGRAREDLKTYFSKKKEQREGYKREKTLGTPCFEEPSNAKHQSSNKTTNHNTLQSKKSADSTGHKLTVVRKSSGQNKLFKEAIGVRRKTIDEVRVQEFTLE